MGSNTSIEFPKELSQSQVETIKSKTGMNSTEIFDWYSQFLDLTKGKELDKDNFVKYYKKIISSKYSGNPDLFCQLAFNAFDSNNNELVDFSEMIIGLTTLTNPNLDERLEWMFKFYDQKRTGYIEEYELKMAVKAILKMKNEDCNDEKINEIAQSIKKSMTNNENISKEEFIKGAKNCEQKYLEIICPSDV